MVEEWGRKERLSGGPACATSYGTITNERRSRPDSTVGVAAIAWSIIAFSLSLRCSTEAATCSAEGSATAPSPDPTLGLTDLRTTESPEQGDGTPSAPDARSWERKRKTWAHH